MTINQDIGNYLSVQENQVINYNKDIVVTDLSGNQKIVVKCYCTITAYRSISYYMDVIDTDIFNAQRETIQLEIDKFKAEATKIAQDHHVPIL